MSKLNIEIKRCDVKTYGNYFIITKLEQITFPDKLVKSNSFRTDIQEETEFPVFVKNKFEFFNIEFGNRISINFGMYITSEKEGYNGSIKNLLIKSKLTGIANQIFTIDFINKLRKHKYIDINLRFYHPQKYNLETGSLFVNIKHNPHSIDSYIYETNKEIEECYYDPFETNKEIIKDKLLTVIEFNEDREIELKKTFDNIHKINQTLKKAAIDLNNTNIELHKLDKENELLLKTLSKHQNIDEIHVEVDLLSQSSYGIDLIKKRYAILIGQIAIQTENAMNLENEYKEISTYITKINLVKEKLKYLKEANNQVKFNIKREDDLMPLISKQIEKTKANDKILKSLQSSIDELVNLNKGNIEETEKKLNSLYLDRKLIEEKTIQMNIHQELFSNNDKQWEENFMKLIGNDVMMNNMYNEREKYWIDQYRKKKHELEDCIKDLSNQVSCIQRENENKFKHTIVIDPGLRKRKIELSNLIDLADRREKILINEIDNATSFYKNEIAKLKDKIEEADKFIDKEVGFAKKNYYKTNLDSKY